jgi:hypothetical protein
VTSRAHTEPCAHWRNRPLALALRRAVSMAIEPEVYGTRKIYFVLPKTRIANTQTVH